MDIRRTADGFDAVDARGEWETIRSLMFYGLACMFAGGILATVAWYCFDRWVL